MFNMDECLMFPISPTMEAMISFAEASTEERKHIIDEGIVLTGLAGLGVASMLFGGDKVVDFIRNVIDSMIRLMKYLVEQLKRLWKWITISARDVNSNNNQFLSKYGAKLSKMMDVSVILDGYDMSANIMAMASNLAVEIRLAGNDVDFITNTLNGDYRFNNHEDINAMINQNRADILDVDRIGSKSGSMNGIRSDDDFRKAFISRLYGYKHPMTFTVADALSIIKTYGSRIAAIVDANKNLEEQGSKDIDKLALLRDSFVSGKLVQAEVKGDIVQQFNWFIEYKQRALNDYVMAFQVMTQYANEINTQAKAVCIKALQDN